jgi:glycosyltransferase involved in cell wall biosynthesis
MRVLFLGSYHRDAERNRILIGGLCAQGVEVVERNAPLPSLRFRGAGFTLLARLAKAGLALPLYAARVALGSRAARQADVVLIGYLGHHDVGIIRLLRMMASGLRCKPIVFDPFFSLYDTVVSDRRLLRPGSIGARALHRVERSLLRWPDLILADTAAHAEYYRTMAGLPRERLAVIPVGVETDLFPHRAPRPADNSFRVLFYGTYIPLHGVDHILRAAHLLRGEDIRFRLIGRGQTRPHADALARQLRLPNVSFTDWVPFDRLVEEIGDSDLVLGIFGVTDKAGRVVPNKVYQAMSVGRCVLTRDSPAIREAFLPGRHLATCPPGDPEALAESILALRGDPGLRSSLADAARDLVVREFSVEAIGARLLSALDGVVKRHG